MYKARKAIGNEVSEADESPPPCLGGWRMADVLTRVFGVLETILKDVVYHLHHLHAQWRSKSTLVRVKNPDRYMG